MTLEDIGTVFCVSPEVYLDLVLESRISIFVVTQPLWSIFLSVLFTESLLSLTEMYPYLLPSMCLLNPMNTLV